MKILEHKMKLEDLKVGMWYFGMGDHILQFKEILLDKHLAIFRSLYGHPSRFNAVEVMQELTPWTPAVGDPVRFDHREHHFVGMSEEREGAYCISFQGNTRFIVALDELEPIVKAECSVEQGEIEQRLEDMRSGKMAAEINESCKELKPPTYEVGDVVVVGDLKDIRYGDQFREPVEMRITGKRDSLGTYSMTQLEDSIDNDGFLWAAGEEWDLESSDILRKVEPECEHWGGHGEEGRRVTDEMKGIQQEIDSYEMEYPTEEEWSRINENHIAAMQARLDHEDSPNGHGAFQDDLQEQGRRKFKPFNGHFGNGQPGLLS